MSKGFTILKDIEGNVFLPLFSGIGGNGIPIQYLLLNDFLIKEIYKLEEELTNEENIKKLGFSCSKNCEFVLKLKNDKLYLFEQTKNEYCDLNLPEIF